MMRILRHPAPTHVVSLLIFSITLLLLTACGEGVPNNPDGSSDVPKRPLNDTGVTYYIDDQNTFFYEKISTKEWTTTQPVDPATGGPSQEYEQSGSPLMYNVLDRSKFPQIPDSAFVQQFSEPNGFPGQDASYGLDATRNNDADGVAGFSFTKLDKATGAELAVTETDYGCVKDNVTGLTWEHKTDNSPANDIHSASAIFLWYDPNPETNGGDAGQSATQSQCTGDIVIGDTQQLITQTNNEALCGKTNWRLPTIEELRSLVDYQVKKGTLPQPAMTDQNFFPYSAAMDHRWTSQTVNLPGHRHKAFGFHMHEGQVQSHDKACSPENLQRYRNGAMLVSD